VERIAIFAALRWECIPILRQLRQVQRERVADFVVWRGSTVGLEVWLVKTGMGTARAAAAARALDASGRFDLFLSTGCAGALARELAPGDLAVATTVFSAASGPRFESDIAHRHLVCRIATRVALRAVVGPVLCSSHVLATAAEKRAAAECGTIAVDMESAAIAAHAAAVGVPFVSVRTILDAADHELRHAGHFIDPHSGALKPLALAGYLAAHPGAVPELLAMHRMRLAAQRSLDRFFRAWLTEASPAAQ
jgi:adenosylhomocysteine nucleosidase